MRPRAPQESPSMLLVLGSGLKSISVKYGNEPNAHQ